MNDETSSEFTSRLDRDSVYRVEALRGAVCRAELHRDIRNDNLQVFGVAEAYYQWLKGDGEDGPKAEEKR